MTTGELPFIPERVLAIGAHPDDIEFGCGGTVARMAKQGAEVTIMIVTNGNKGSHDPQMVHGRLLGIRQDEQHAAAGVLGAKRVIFLGYNDGELEATMALRLEMALYIRLLKPDVVFTHDPWRRYMLHPDHRAVGFSVIDGMVNARDRLFTPGLEQVGIAEWRPKQLYLWMPDEPNHIEDISEVIDQKLAALREHHSQLDRTPDVFDRLRKYAAQAAKDADFAYGESLRLIET